MWTVRVEDEIQGVEVGVASAILSISLASPRLCYVADFLDESSAMLCYVVDYLGESSAMWWLSCRPRWQALGYFVEFVGESSAMSMGMSGDLGKSV